MNLSTERIVNQFPSPYSGNVCLQNALTFDNKVRDYCEQNLSPSIATNYDPFNLSAKCILVGDVAVGKTCLLNRFTYDSFGLDHKATIGVDFAVIKYKILQVPFQLQIWDTAGQERFQSIAINYYRGANCAIIVYDMSEISTLRATINWANQVKHGNKSDECCIFLVGTKSDTLPLTARNFVEEEAQKIALQLSAEYWTVSSKTGENVDELFNRIAALNFDYAIKLILWKKEEEKREKAIQYHDNFVKITNKRKNFTVIKSCFMGKCWPKNLTSLKR